MTPRPSPGLPNAHEKEAEVTDQNPANEPVNIAKPQWACPHCGRNFHQDVAAATVCAQAGPAPDARSGISVLILASSSGNDRDTTMTLGLTEAGPVRAETVDGAVQHRRDVTVSGKVLNTNELAARIAEQGDDLVVLGHRHGEPAGYAPNPGPSSYGLLDTLFGARSSYYSYNDNGPAVWITDRPHSSWDTCDWWRTPDDAERAVLNMLTAGLLDKVAESEPDKLAGQIADSYKAGAYRSSSSKYQKATDLAVPSSALAVAAQHGAPSHIWALRWLALHTTTVTAWHAQQVIAWAAGTGGPIPMPRGLYVYSGLPKSPGKRRTALMEPYGGGDYNLAMRKLTEQLVTEAPDMPVPGLGNVLDELRNTSKGNPTHA
jgi:hypothetical protein